MALTRHSSCSNVTPTAQRALWFAVGAFLGLYVVAFGFSTLVRLQQPIEFLYGEAVVLAQIHQLNAGQPLYPPINRLPLSVTAYTPVYYLVVAALQRVTGDTTYLPGRLLSVAATLGSAGLLCTSIRQVSRSWWGGLLAAGLFLTQNLTALLWAPAHRVDSLALCFTLAGLMLSSFGRSRLAGIPLVLAVLTKQTYVTAIISVAIQLWPRRRAMLLFLAPVVACVLLVLVVGQVLSGGWLVWHTVIADANPLNIDYFSAMFTEFIQLNAVPVIAAAALLAIPSLPGERQWRAYFVLSGLQALLTVGKLGASSNYWLEMTAATAALIGIGAVRLTRDVTIRRGFSSATLAGVVLAGLLTVVPGYAATVTATAQLALMDKPPAQLAIAADVAREPGDVLTDDPSLALLAGKPVEFEFIIFTILAAGHIWDERPILDAIASHRFSLVILSQPLEEPAQPLISARWSPAVHDAILANYAAAGQDGAYWLYRERA